VPIATANKVADASALVALLFAEPAGEEVYTVLSRGQLTAPNILPYEIANAALMKVRRRRMDQDRALAGLDRYSRLEIELMDIQMDEVFSLAAETGLTAYDASYLWLARKLDCQLVTLDKKLHAAAGRLAAP
jgi:predicted nucleic acid-binding protein